MEEGFKVPSLDIIRPAKVVQSKALEEEEKTPGNSSDVQDKLEASQTSPVVECPYVEPKWSGRPSGEETYSFEILKTGTIIEVIESLEKKPYWVFGRLPQCDIPMAHPTISRFHAVLQYRPEDENPLEAPEDVDPEQKKKKVEPGWYLYDLTSTHGTFVNKQRVPPKTYIRIHVGYIIKLGASTRQFILQGPTEDEEEESQLSITELKELKKQQAIEMLKNQENERLEREKRERAKEEEGISWGMADDAEEEEVDLSVNPFATTNNEQLFLDDPKKTLRGFFEREGLNLEYKCEEMSQGTFVCRVELPVDDAQGRPIVAEVCHKGKKKECVVQCALEACRILDRHGVLRQANHEPLRRRVPKSDSDDDDDFLDRTGDVQRRRQRKTASGETSAVSYEDLLEQQRQIQSQMEDIDQKIEEFKESEKMMKNAAENEADDIDDFMTNLGSVKKLDKTEIRRLRMEQQRLTSELLKVERLAKIAAPHLPSIKSLAAPESGKKKQALPLFGKRTKLRNDFGVKREERKVPAVTHSEEIEEEIEEKEVPQEEDSLKTQEVEQKRILGPTIDPEVLRRISSKTSEEEKHEDEPQKRKLLVSSDQEADEEDKSEPSSSKKRKSRVRNRDKTRENIDMPDEDLKEDSEKFSGWLPPENQKGDGMTELNQKLGY